MTKTKESHIFTIEVDQDLFKSLNLLHKYKPEGSYNPLAESYGFNNEKKITHLLKTLTSLSSAQFPLLKEGEWGQLIYVTQPAFAEESALMIIEAVNPAHKAFLLGELKDTYDDLEWKNLDKSRIENLSPGETFTVMLASERYWGPDKESLRDILSDISQRPRECVFFEDPSPDDLWTVQSINRSDQNAVRVDYGYNGQPMASMKFIYSAEQARISCMDFTCIETRRMVLPGVKLKDHLFQMVARVVAETLRGDLQGVV